MRNMTQHGLQDNWRFSALPEWLCSGQFSFFSLITVHIITCHHATALTMPDDVIDHVHWLVQHQKLHPRMVFGDCNLMQMPDDIVEVDEDADDNDCKPEDSDDKSSLTSSFNFTRQS